MIRLLLQRLVDFGWWLVGGRDYQPPPWEGHKPEVVPDCLGTVKFYDPGKGYGFLDGYPDTRVTGRTDVGFEALVHFTDLGPGVEGHLDKYGLHLLFDVVKSHKGLIARNVRLYDPGIIVG